MVLSYKENSLKIWRIESERREECLDERMDDSIASILTPFYSENSSSLGARN